MCQLHGCILDNISKGVVFSIYLSVVKVLDPSKADVRIVVEDLFALAVVCELVCDWYEVVQRLSLPQGLEFGRRDHYCLNARSR